MSDDGVSVTLKMRPDIKFSDGSPITVNDVKWSLDRARDPKNGIWNFIARLGRLDRDHRARTRSSCI